MKEKEKKWFLKFAKRKKIHDERKKQGKIKTYKSEK